MILRFAKGCGEPALIFTEEALEQMTEYRQNAGQREAGGQLFGIIDEQNVLIVEATPPCKNDRRGLFRFRPNRQREQEEIQGYYKKGLHFVGDWHTHLQIIPTPSETDLTSIRDCFQKSCHDLLYFVLVIIGTAPLPQGLYVALVNKNQVEKLVPE